MIESGARRQENRWDPIENEQVVPETKEVSKKLFDDAMFKLEHNLGDKKTAKSQDRRLNKIIAANDAQWKDDYSANCALRAAFRTQKNDEKKMIKSSLINNVGVNLSLVREHEDDIKLAQLLMQNKRKERKEEKKISLKRLLTHARSIKKSKVLVNNLTKSHIFSKKSAPLLAVKSTKSSEPSTSQNTTLVNYDTSSESDNS